MQDGKVCRRESKKRWHTTELADGKQGGEGQTEPVWDVQQRQNAEQVLDGVTVRRLTKRRDGERPHLDDPQGDAGRQRAVEVAEEHLEAAALGPEK